MIISEDIKNSLFQVNEGKRIYRKIVKNINNIDYKEIPMNDDRFMLKDTKNRSHQLYGVYFNLKEFKEKYDLNIIFAHKIDKANSEPVFDRKSNSLIFFIISQSDKLDYNNNVYLSKIRFKAWIDENVFIHEFIHYLDSLKYNQNYNLSYNKAIGTYGFLKSYYNSPEEFNAILSELFYEIIKHKKQFMGLDVRTFIIKSFKLVDKEFIKHLTLDNKNKIIKKLYKLYSHLNQ